MSKESTVAATDYKTEHVKRDPMTGTLALRTQWPDEAPFTEMAWATFTTGPEGARHRPTSHVAEWDDLYVPAGDG